MKEVVYRYGIRQASKLLALAEKATETLEGILGQNAPLVSAEWDSGRGPSGSPVVILTLSDSDGSAKRVFDPEDLISQTQLEIRLLLLWDDLLQIRTHKQLQELLSSSEAKESG